MMRASIGTRQCCTESGTYYSRERVAIAAIIEHWEKSGRNIHAVGER